MYAMLLLSLGDLIFKAIVGLSYIAGGIVCVALIVFAICFPFSKKLRDFLSGGDGDFHGSPFV
jgi:ABC-type cobalamin transport system permease subunit